MKRYIQIVLDMMMLTLMVLLMGYHIMSGAIHEYMGICLFVLFIIHHIINKNWMMNIRKGQYTYQRKWMLVINCGLFIDMFFMIISGLLISQNLFSFFHMNYASLGRKIHLVSTAWAFILISIHLGFHVGKIKFLSKYKLVKIILGCQAIYGIYAFINRKLWQDLFLIVEFKFFDYFELPIVFYFDCICIVILLAWCGYALLRVNKNRETNQ